MDQFKDPPSVITVRQICKVRQNAFDPIEIRLQKISPEQLEVVRRHGSLYGSSLVFRQVHEKMGEKLFQAKAAADGDVQRGAGSDDDSDAGDDYASDASDDDGDGGHDGENWPKLIAGAREMFGTYESLINRLVRHEISIGEVQEFFEDSYKKGHLMQDLKALDSPRNPKDWRPKIEQSIRRLFTIQQYSEAAETIQNVVAVMRRESPFEIVDNILKATKGGADFLSQPLRVISEELIRAGETFSAWGKPQIETLAVLNKSGKILRWLNENIKDRGDLKTFYELATISAGEGDMEVDKVSNFYQSIIGYAPLLLDLDVQKCTFDEFLAACKSVFAALERDPNIASKLLDSNRCLEWIQACKDQQGSVEQTSLTLVGKANSTGIYTISMPKKEASEQPCIENCIKMSYIKVANQEVVTDLSLEELQELRSKLMLITAGADGKKDVERFAKTLSLVELVTKHFISLVKAGCHLFLNWRLKVSSSLPDSLS